MSKIIKYQQGTTLTGPTIRGKKYPKGTIVTNDPNDPRIQAYLDSLALYNKAENGRNILEKDFDWIRYGNVLSTKDVFNIINRLNPKGETWQGQSGRLFHGNTTLTKFGNSTVGEVQYQDNIKDFMRKSQRIQPIGWKPELLHGAKYDPNTLYDYSAVYKKPTQPIVYEPFVNRMTPKGLPASTQPIPQMLNMPDRIEMDSRKGAEYKGIKVNHYTDALGRYTAKLNLTTTPGVNGKISYKNGGILKFQSGGKPTTQDSLQLLENSNAVRKYYDNPKYMGGKQSYIYEDNDYMHKDNLEALQDFIQRGREAYTHQNVKILPLGVYYQNIDKNKYKQRETINDILDIRSPMTLYDRRINPRENKYYDNIDPDDPLYGDAINIPAYSRLQLTPINQLTPQERVQRQKLYGVNPGETNYLVQPKKTLQQVSKFVPTSRSESKPIRMTSKPLHTTPQLIPNERVLPEVVYKDNSVPNNAYGKGINVTHFTDSLGRYAAKMNLTTKNGIFGRLSIPNPKGDYRIKYQSGGSTNKLYTASVAPVEIVDSPLGRGKFLLDYEKQNPYRPYTTTNQYLIKYKPDRVALAEASNRAEWERLRDNYADVKMREQERIANIGQSGRVRGMNFTPEQEKNLIQTQSEGRLAWKNKDPLQKISKVAQETSLALVPELITFKGLPKINPKLMKTRNPRLTVDELTALREELAVNGIISSQKTPNLPWKEPIRKGIEPWNYDTRQATITGTRIGDIKGGIFGGKNPLYLPDAEWRARKLQLHKRLSKTREIDEDVIESILHRPKSDLSSEPSLKKALTLRDENRFPEAMSELHKNRYATWNMYLGKPQTNHPLYDISELSTKDRTIYTIKDNFMDKKSIEESLSEYVANAEHLTAVNKDKMLYVGTGDMTKRGNNWIVPDGDQDYFGTMGGFHWKINQLPNGNYRAIANDVWDLHPLQSLGKSKSYKADGTIENPLLDKLKNVVLKPFRKIEFGKTLGIGKPLNVKVGFEYDPNTKKIIKTF